MFNNVNKNTQMSSMDALNETVDFFAAKKINILGEGYKTVKEDEKLFGDYVSSLTEGLDATDQSNVAQLIKNNNTETLIESFTNGAAIGALAAPMIRQAYPRLCIKDAVSTVVATTARPMILYTLPYLSTANEDGTEKRVYLPRGLKGDYADKEIATGGNAKVTITKDASKTNFNVGFSGLANPDYNPAYVIGPVNENTSATWSNPFVAKSGSRIKVQPLDIFTVYSLQVGEKVHLIDKKVTSVNGEQIFTVDGNIHICVKLQKKEASAKVFVVGLDGEASTKVVLTVIGHASTEFNESSWDVNLEIKRKDYDIASGDHLNAPISFDQIKDMKTMYDIDATQEILDTMTMVFGQRTDLELINWLDNEFTNQPTSEAGYADLLANGDVRPTSADFIRTFDCAPKGNFAGTPTAWIDSELKRMINQLCQVIKNKTYLNQGKFHIIGNPLDTGLLQNIDWKFQAGSTASGASVDYGVGTLVGVSAIKVIATPLIKEGKLKVLFIPNRENQVTYRYMPYVFGTEMNYRSANRTLVPNVMMTKRHTYFSVTPAMGEITILNNGNGNYGFNEKFQTNGNSLA